MRCTVAALHQVKHGNRDDEYEDAFAFASSAVQAADREMHVAVADGATEASFAGAWAAMLAHAYHRGEIQSVAELHARVESLAQCWWSELRQRELPWYAEAKARQGAFSTLLGLSLFPAHPLARPDSGPPAGPPSGAWRALAIGDSCLFQVRSGDLMLSLPIVEARQFDHAPRLLSTHAAANADVWDGVVTHAGEWIAGDVFILATDALAHWLLDQHERGHSPWPELLRIANDAQADNAFRAWVAECRANWGLRNDDVTCVVVTVTASADDPADVEHCDAGC